MLILLAIPCAYLLDLLLGDPDWLPHPVILMGKAIATLEKGLRSHLPTTPRGEFSGGLLIALLLPLSTLLLSGSLCWLAAWIHPLLGFLLQSFWCFQALAVKGLRDESLRVFRALKDTSIQSARRALSRIVGRDTEQLFQEGIVKATVETVSENFCDGVLAPLFYMTIGGAPLALCYKAVNTMDSMLGYQNERYQNFGRAAAKLDDAANYLPARLAALLWIAAAALCGQDAKEAFRIWRRDRRKHKSPNAAQTEAACAGALGIELAGPASYFGILHDKDRIGDALRPVVAEDILRSQRALYFAAFLGLCLCCTVRAILLLL